MIQFCVMGAHEGRMQPNKRVYVTLMGACELYRPTLARRIVEQKRRVREGKSRNWYFFLTLMGATEIHVPTLAEEFIDLREVVNSGLMSLEEMDRAFAEMGAADDATISSVTLMGGFSDAELPSEDTEVDSLALHRHLGNISEAVGQTLQTAIGLREAERRAALRSAMQAAAARL